MLNKVHRVVIFLSQNVFRLADQTEDNDVTMQT